MPQSCRASAISRAATLRASKFGPRYLPATIEVYAKLPTFKINDHGICRSERWAKITGKGFCIILIDELAAATICHQMHPGQDEISARIAECDRKLTQYRAALDAGADPVTVARWITETETERAGYQAIKRAVPRPAQASMSRDEIASVVRALADLLTVVRTARPADKAQIYTGLGLRLTYQPSQRLVRTEVHLSPAHWQFESVRGGIEPVSPQCCIGYSAEIDL